jgi:hypothetical protein
LLYNFRDCSECSAQQNTIEKETTKHAHRRALVLTAHKLVRLIDALLRQGTTIVRRRHGQSARGAGSVSDTVTA